MARGRYGRRKYCRFCKDGVDHIDYKNADLLKDFVPERGKILPRRTTGTCSRHQRMLTRALKRAREIALVPFTTA